MAVLVTGASGFLGGWLVRRLVERGERVAVLHRASSSLREIEDLDFASRLGDVTDADSVARALTDDVDAVYHLAGVVGYSRAERALMERVNVGGTRNVLDAIRRAPRAPKLIYLSSVTAVGASRVPKALNEDSTYDIEALDLGYFETKRAAEVLVRESGLDAVILNPSTIYGAGDARKGSRRTQLKVARGELPFYTSGGVSVVSVHDVVDAILTARARGRRGERYILAGENITIKDLFARIARFAGQKPPSIYLPNPVVGALGFVGDALERVGRRGPLNTENAWTARLYHWFDHEKARAELGFNPRPADDALRESVAWMKQEGLLNA